MFSSLYTFVLLAVLGNAQQSIAAPSPADWKAFNQTVGGRLGVGRPFSHPCFQAGDSASFNAAECEVIRNNYEEHLFRSDHFGSYTNTQWETCQTTGDQCLLDWTDPDNKLAFQPPRQCKQGSVSNYYVDVTGANDVVAALKFAQSKKVNIVVKNTGHDYIGRSAAPGSLALWTHNLKKLEFSKTFSPEKCPSVKAQPAITIGAGQQFQYIFEFAKANNVTFLGGADPSVGASGGWVQGGGHSALSVTQGLGVDRVLEFKVVTPDGISRVANKCQNPDLFYALKGGGGGTFGVVLESTFIASPKVTVQVVLGLYNNTRANSFKLIKALGDVAVQQAKDGWGGYITPALSSAVWANPLLDAEAAKKSAAGVTAAFESVGGETQFFTTDTFTDFFETFIAPNPDQVSRPQVMATRLIPDTGFSDKVLMDSAINAMLDSDFGQILIVTPYSFKNYKDEDSPINPAWRTAVWHALTSYFWNYDSTLAERVGKYQRLEKEWAVVRQRTPKSGAYFNEADVYEPDWQRSFWGDNYPKLLAIKKKYDPNHIFDCWRCVGWNGPTDPRYKCYPKI